MISVGLTRSAAKLLPSNGTSIIRNIALLAQTARHDGSSSRALYSYDINRHPTRIVGVNIDMTERKRAQAALEESEARYRALYDDNPSMYFTVNTSGTVLSVNEFGARQLGYTPAELVGQSVFKVIHRRGPRGGATASCFVHGD